MPSSQFGGARRHQRRDNRRPALRRAGQWTERDQAACVQVHGLWQRCRGNVLDLGGSVGPVASPARRVPGRRRRAARGSDRDGPRPGCGGQRIQPDGDRAGPCTGGGAGRQSAGSQPPASRPAGSRNRSDANPSSGIQQAESADRPGKQDGKAHKDREAGRDRAQAGAQSAHWYAFNCRGVATLRPADSRADGYPSSGGPLSGCGWPTMVRPKGAGQPDDNSNRPPAASGTGVSSLDRSGPQSRIINEC